MSQLSSFRSALLNSKNPIAMAGAGLSAASGIPTFRGPSGLWRQFDPISLATPSAFKKDPSLVWQFYHMRREKCLKANPNQAHKHLADFMILQEKENKNFHLITQNVDGLSIRSLDQSLQQYQITTKTQRKLSDNLLEMHGSLFKTICTSCHTTSFNFDSPICESLAGTEDQTKPYSPIPIEQLPRCNHNGCAGLLRPGVDKDCMNSLSISPFLFYFTLGSKVWFGESIPLLPKISSLISSCDLILVLGTSSTVYPAASFAQEVKANGGKVAVFNLEKSGSSDEEIAGEDGVDWFFEGRVEETLGEALGI